MASESGEQPPVLIFGSHLAALGVLRVLARRGIPAYVADDTSNVITRSRWYRAADRTLRETAKGGFTNGSSTPPLLYHNDLSASPPHYHWSEDFGYALWLRLYVETARRWKGSLPPPGGPAKNQ